MSVASRAPRVGDIAPEIALPLVGGGVTWLSAYRGRRLLVFMWGAC